MICANPSRISVIDEEEIQDVGYGSKRYVATAPVTITFHGKLSEEASIAQWVDDEGLNVIEVAETVVLTEYAEYGYGSSPSSMEKSSICKTMSIILCVH